MRTQIRPFPTQEDHTYLTRAVGWGWLSSTTQGVLARERLQPPLNTGILEGTGRHLLLQGSSQPGDRTQVSCTAGRV